MSDTQVVPSSGRFRKSQRYTVFPRSSIAASGSLGAFTQPCVCSQYLCAVVNYVTGRLRRAGGFLSCGGVDGARCVQCTRHEKLMIGSTHGKKTS